MTDNRQPQSDNSVRRTTSGLRWGHRTRSVAVAAAVALIASAISALIAPGKADAAALCASSRNPYAGAHVVRVYSQRGITVRRYTKAGLGPLYVATADIAHAVAMPILPSHVTVRTVLGNLVANSKALVGVNGDFFRRSGDGTSMSVEVVAGGRVIKAKAGWQPALVTTPAGRLIYGPLRANIALSVGKSRYLASVINDSTMPHNGVGVFTPNWGSREPEGGSPGWREWIVSGGRVVATHAYATHAVIPGNGFVVEASGVSATRMQAQGWRTGAVVALHVNAISTIGPVYAALGAGSRLVHNGAVDRGGCVHDQPTGRTSVGVYAGARQIAMASVSTGRGMSEGELAAFMRSLGVREAVSLDGGGSSTMASHGQRFTGPRNGVYRPVPNGLGFYPR